MKRFILPALAALFTAAGATATASPIPYGNTGSIAPHLRDHGRQHRRDLWLLCRLQRC